MHSIELTMNLLLIYNSVLSVQKYLLTELVKAGIPAMIVIGRKGGTRGSQQKNLQKLDSIQSEGGPKDPILLEAPKARFQFERTHRYLKKFSGVN